MMNWIRQRFAIPCLCIAAAVGTVGYGVCDVARAESPAPTTAPAPGKLTATLDNGLVVELLSIYSTDEKIWWDPFGTPLAAGFYNPAIQGNRTQSLEYYITLCGGPEKNWNATNIKWSASSGVIGFAGARYDKEASPKGVQGIRLINMQPNAPDKTSIKLSFSTEEERSYAPLIPAEAHIATADIPKLGAVELSNPQEVDGRGAIEAVIPKPSEGMQVIVTARPVRKPNTPVTPILAVKRSDALGGTDNEIRKIVFNAKLSDIRSFEVRVRSYDKWVEFRDVSLKSAVSSAATVATSDDSKAN